MREKWNEMAPVRRHYYIAFFVSLFVAISLMVGGFFCPPKGKIDGSVLEAVGIIFLWPALAFGAKALEEGHRAQIRKGDTTITLGEVLKDGDGFDEPYPHRPMTKATEDEADDTFSNEFDE